MFSLTLNTDGGVGRGKRAEGEGMRGERVGEIAQNATSDFPLSAQNNGRVFLFDLSFVYRLLSSLPKISNVTLRISGIDNAHTQTYVW